MFCFIGKYLILSKRGHEIVDFLNPNSKYELLANNVPRVSGATGGLLQNTPIVCGGDDDNYLTSQDCVVIGKPEMEMRMIEKRKWAACVALDPCTLWVVGGDKGSNYLKSTEFIKLSQPSIKGPDLPFTIYIIGGDQNGSFPSKTWIVEPTNEFEIKEGPTLNEARIWLC